METYSTMKLSIRMRFLVVFLLCLKGVYASHFLTFIIPCYNCERWIAQAVDSIYQQDLPCPFEIVCTDDGSTDNTFAVLSALSQEHPEMRLVRHEMNRGGGAARNTCVAHSQGDIIFCLDADNILPPNTVHLLIQKMDETQADVSSFGGIQYFVGDLQFRPPFFYKISSEGYSLQDILQNTNTPPWSGNYLFTRASFDLVGGYPELTIDTFGFGFKQALHGCKMVFAPGTVYWHRVDIGGYYTRASTTRKLQIDFFDLLLQHRQLLTKKTILLLEEQRRLATGGSHFHDQIYLLECKMIHLRAL
jgi:glycosyltransferase involved in cell wall biosynthesis